ncbi:hypothetical protein GFS31_16440 [Leptolyngbya sp. BL0902]|uniref:DUF1269 domain-containing protein n=1 Tax=Leptolyngbya sp. BL0902 TaxID=1115757 RepID=UPI0018E7FBAD|nr:DUF1269 domain-containing protein [Leptolyngbya sp. BL0902]QQE64960.1 hypothetical protein GFS31_16440 [Leptolyngbya sp. BL0902]
MSESPVQVIVAAFNSVDGAGLVMEDIKQGKRDGLIGIIDAAVVVKNAEGKLKITDAKRRSRKGLMTGGVVGGLIGLVLAPPAVAVAAGGGVIGALVGKLRSAPLKAEMKDLGSALQPNTSAIIAVIEHTWVEQLEAALAAAGAQLIREVIKADIAEQLEAGGNVLYTAGAGTDALGAARIAQTTDSLSIGGVAITDEGLFLDSAEILLAGDDEDEENSSSMA